ncbi:MAG: helix-turn-helix transcriptional regulator [Candidatus Micrarchaeia archaeon]|jgi:putative transcriptional regulator
MRNHVEGARRRAKLTQEQLAQDCGVTRQTIIAIERGNYNPSLQLAYDLVRALKKRKVEDLFEGP